MPPKTVTVAVAEKKDVPFYLDEIGNCTAFQTVTVQSQVSGPIMAPIHFTDGQELKEGDPLFTIDKRPYQAAVDKAAATLAQDQAKHDNDVTQLKRTIELSKTKVVAQQDVDNAQATADGSAATVQADQAALEQAQINLNYCDIKSPIDGRASDRKVDIGNVVTANSTQLLLIQRQDPIYANFIIPESALPLVRDFIDKGTLKVQASFPDDPSKSRVGDFDFLDSGVQQASGTVRMRAKFHNEDRLFWPGQFVKIRILLKTLNDAVLVPSEAVQVGENGPTVFILNPKDNTVSLANVTVGQRQGSQTVITKGVNAGDTVIVTGQLMLFPGTKVTPVPDDKAS
ncbi:MAG TPA: efflux RND transporter periplasmic adaptor subunit [Chthoniobacteraceae bacterium]|nr:efflux RND transporter periplasmic adaptor subunit [Chthoniobacteraceae bacterium]